MRPLHWVAVGLIVVVFTVAPDDAFDAAEIVGNASVLVGLALLSRAVDDLPLRMTLWYLAVISLAVACVTAFPDARAWLDDADPAVVWASSLPALSFQVALCHSLSLRARAAGSRTGVWWTAAEVAIASALLGGVLYDGAGWTWLDGIGAVGLAGVLLVIVLCISTGNAAWAGAKPRPEAARKDRSGDSS